MINKLSFFNLSISKKAMPRKVSTVAVATEENAIDVKQAPGDKKKISPNKMFNMEINK